MVRGIMINTADEKETSLINEGIWYFPPDKASGPIPHKYL